MIVSRWTLALIASYGLMYAASTAKIYAYVPAPLGSHPFSAEWIRSYNVAYGDSSFIEAAIDQGRYDDCFYESSIGSLSLSARGARLLSKMITADGSGGWNVTFLDTPGTTYSVSRQDFTQMGLKDACVWAKVLEAAFLKRFPLMQQGPQGFASQCAVFKKMGYAANNQAALTFLTGHKADSFVPADISESQLTEMLTRTASFSNGMVPPYAVVAGAKPAPPKTTILVGKHCYSIVHYDSHTQVVTVRNPWGHNYPTKEFPNLVAPGQTKGGITNEGSGILKMHVQTFIKHFENMGYSRIFQE